MSRTRRSRRRNTFIRPSLALAGLPIIAFTMSVLTGERIEARSFGTRQPPNCAVSQKVLGSDRDIKDRFAAAKQVDRQAGGGGVTP
jgi:hypothetical protein